MQSYFWRMVLISSSFSSPSSTRPKGTQAEGAFVLVVEFHEFVAFGFLGFTAALLVWAEGVHYALRLYISYFIGRRSG
jgi:hypothetical protein